MNHIWYYVVPTQGFFVIGWSVHLQRLWPPLPVQVITLSHLWSLQDVQCLSDLIFPAAWCVLDIPIQDSHHFASADDYVRIWWSAVLWDCKCNMISTNYKYQFMRSSWYVTLVIVVFPGHIGMTAWVQLKILESAVYNWLGMLNGDGHVQRYIRASTISDHINELGQVRILHILIWLIITHFPCARLKKPINEKGIHHGWRRAMEVVITLSVLKPV